MQMITMEKEPTLTLNRCCKCREQAKPPAFSSCSIRWVKQLNKLSIRFKTILLSVICNNMPLRWPRPTLLRLFKIFHKWLPSKWSNKTNKSKIMLLNQNTVVNLNMKSPPWATTTHRWTSHKALISGLLKLSRQLPRHAWCSPKPLRSKTNSSPSSNSRN